MKIFNGRKFIPKYALTREWLDIAFDILYFGDTSVIHQSLKERHEILRKVVRPLNGRLEILLPNNGGINSHRPSGKIFSGAICLVMRAYFTERLLLLAC